MVRLRTLARESGGTAPPRREYLRPIGVNQALILACYFVVLPHDKHTVIRPGAPSHSRRAFPFHKASGN